MKVNRKIVAEKLKDYLDFKISHSQLVDWAENIIEKGEFDENDVEILREIVGYIGLSDVKEFGLSWEDCKNFLEKLGFKVKVEVIIN
ncbi:MAG TPA: hypothetical protein P5150_02265 [Candidatus Ratteibacteria bacterium]|nr:hypothetical protein [bacterium]HRR95545.1 hypothetical protein [Candidatus Ratteibacteria bacterium]